MSGSHLHRHCDIGGLVKDFLDCSIISLADILVKPELTHAYRERGAIREIDARSM
jgi:hypothetical protein